MHFHRKEYYSAVNHRAFFSSIPLHTFSVVSCWIWFLFFFFFKFRYVPEMYTTKTAYNIHVDLTMIINVWYSRITFCDYGYFEGAHICIIKMCDDGHRVFQIMIMYVLPVFTHNTMIIFVVFFSGIQVCSLVI